MAFLHPVRHLPTKFHTELLVLVSAILLLLLSFIIVSWVHSLPKVRTVPQPVVAGSSTQRVPLHFSKLQGSQSLTEPAPRSITLTPSTTPLQAALTQLLKGPTPEEKANGYYSEIPAGTKLLNVQEKDDTVIVNLSHEFTSGGGSTSMLQRVNELESTIHSVAGNRTIQIAIEGKPLHVLGGEGLELD